MPSKTRVSRRRLLAVCALLTLTGCSDSGGGSGASSTASANVSSSASAAGSSGSAHPATIIIQNFAFKPAKMTVAPGTKVTVMNKDSTTHTLTAITGKAWNTGDIAAGKKKTFTAPKKTGKFDYMCTIHPFMKGTLTVK
ncbi:cupredoxin domain-containing protein [Streptomyces sp. NBC_01190]|uniref:cupredoxin domain-containing protein n=1 Tax=Streptomyces sp. NBC_01190 TaxID=2903767 RepID=UPI003863A500|nr:cupredoxin domain-containing protein [Streptomyces sp. NBC_01190]